MGARVTTRTRVHNSINILSVRLRWSRLETDLRKVLVVDDFELYYQPVVNLRSKEVRGCEARLRWHHPTRGFISSAEFIPTAEDTLLMIPIGG